MRSTSRERTTQCAATGRPTSLSDRAAAGGPRILLLFADGVGLAPAGPGNPLSSHPTPALSGLLGGPLTTEQVGRTDGAWLRGLDATLGVPGLPQSATGQTSLFTGRNGAALLGRHLSAFPGPRLRELIRRHGLLGRAAERGLECTFANAFTPGYLEALRQGRARPSATTCTVLEAGLPFRQLEDLERGEAVSWDICGDLFGRRAGVDVEPVEPAAAGRHLAGLAARRQLTLFETFVTDLAGHLKRGVQPAEAVRRLDGLVGGALAARSPETTVLLTSDHGNLEDATGGAHTKNPVPLLAVGPAAERFADLDSILGVTPRVLQVLTGNSRRG